MSVIPKKKSERIEFCEDHIAPWTTNATALNVATATVTDFQTKTESARTKYEAYRAARDAAKSALTEYDVALQAMTVAASDIIKQIRATAATGGDGIYALAALPAPAIPSPVGNPGTPEAFKATLLPNGSLELSWKCTNPPGSQGILYHVFRKNEGGEWDFLGATGMKQFPDTTVPSGTGTVLYQIRAARSTAVGIAAEFVVNLGVTPGGTMTASVASAPKLAA